MMQYFTVLLTVILPMVVQAQQCTFSIKGHVIDKDMNNRLPNAVVKILEANKTVKTDGQGDFTFSNLCAGSYTIVVTHVHCDTFKKQYQLANDLHVDIELPHTINVEGEAIVTASREPQNSGMKKTLSGLAMQTSRGDHLAKALTNLNGVTMLQTGNNTAKPVVHGLFGNRLLTITNGVRHEGQQWGNEHAPEVDPFLVDKIMVIKGVDELKYGSDAIGGVILLDPKPLIAHKGKHIDFFTGYSSNNGLVYTSAVVDWMKKENVAYRANITVKKAGNATTPDYRMNNTGLEELNLSFASKFNIKQKVVEIFASHFGTKLGVFSGSHIGNTTDLLAAIRGSRPSEVFTGERTYAIARPKQEVIHQILKINTQWKKAKYNWNVQISGQHNQREEFDMVRNPNNKRPQVTLNVASFQEQITLDYKQNDDYTQQHGVTAVQQINSYRGRYIIPHYTLLSFGAFSLHKWKLKPFDLQAGVRMDYKTISTFRQQFSGQISNFHFNFPTLAGSVNLSKKINSNISSNVGIAYSTRAPYVNELLSDGIHHGTATYDIGDVNLKPEQSLFATWNVLYAIHEKWTAELSLHTNRLQHFIYPQPLPNQPVLTIAGAFPAIAWRQTNAWLNGADIQSKLSLSKAIDWNVKWSGLYCKNLKTDEWLLGMPANRVTQSISFRFEDLKKLQDNNLQVQWERVGEQRRIPNDYLAKHDFKMPPASYQIWHITYTAYLPIKDNKLHVSLLCNNIFNTRYRDYQNSFRYFADEIGRNVQIKLNYSIH